MARIAVEHQEAAERVGNGEPERLGPGVRPRLGLVGLPLEGPHDRGAARRLHRHQARQRRADPAQLRAARAAPWRCRPGPRRRRSGRRSRPAPASRAARRSPARSSSCLPAGRAPGAWTTSWNPGRSATAALMSRPASPISPSTRYVSRPGRHALGPGDLRGVGRHDDQAGQPGPGRVGRPGRPGVPVVGRATPGGPELGRAGHAHRRAAGLERPGGQRALVLHQQPGHAELRAQALHGQQRRHALAEAHHGPGRAHRQQLVVAPQARRPRGDLVRAGQRGGPRHVIAGQQRRAAAAGSLDLTCVVGVAGTGSTPGRPGSSTAADGGAAGAVAALRGSWVTGPSCIVRDIGSSTAPSAAATHGGVPDVLRRARWPRWCISWCSAWPTACGWPGFPRSSRTWA